MKKLVFVVAALGCGGHAAAPAVPHETGQGLADATSRVCAAPLRAAADLEWNRSGGPENDPVVTKHLADGVTNARVLGVIKGWSGDKSVDQKVAELDVLTHDALLSSKCRLREYGKPAS